MLNIRAWCIISTKNPAFLVIVTSHQRVPRHGPVPPTGCLVGGTVSRRNTRNSRINSIRGWQRVMLYALLYWRTPLIYRRTRSRAPRAGNISSVARNAGRSSALLPFRSSLLKILSSRDEEKRKRSNETELVSIDQRRTIRIGASIAREENARASFAMGVV